MSEKGWSIFREATPKPPESIEANIAALDAQIEEKYNALPDSLIAPASERNITMTESLNAGDMSKTPEERRVALYERIRNGAGSEIRQIIPLINERLNLRGGKK